MLKICNKRVTEKYLKHASLKINPNPILLMGGAMISISGGLELLKDIPVGSKVKLQLNNHFGDEFPCIDPEAVSTNYLHTSHHNSVVIFYRFLVKQFLFPFVLIEFSMGLNCL